MSADRQAELEAAAEAGAWFEEDRFRRPESRALRADGLLLCFDRYEVRAWIPGAVESSVDAATLLGPARPEGPAPRSLAETLP